VHNHKQWLTVVLIALALSYAFLAGLHTVQEFDLGWQLASGRWAVQHLQIPSKEVFSYTAPGQEWIYPAFSGIVFYGLYQLGGYSLLSCFGALISAVTIAILVRRKSLVTGVLAILAVPLIAERTAPRAEMFTTLLFAAFLSLLWQHYRTGRSPLWLMPMLMVAWVNLHLGFITGLILCAGYVVLHTLDLLFAKRRQLALRRLHAATPWLAATLTSTLVNPWGPHIFNAVIRQQQAMPVHAFWITEWSPVRFSSVSLQQMLSWRDPQSGFWWFLVVAVAGCSVAFYFRRLGAPLLYLWFGYLAIQHVRFQALFAIVVVILNGSFFSELLERIPSGWWPAEGSGTVPTRRLAISLGCVLAFLASLGALTAIRIRDLASNRYYLRSSELSVFGAGLSWWCPERAAKFIEANKLPSHLFAPYDLGGYVTWRLGPHYADYIDGRAIPFGSDLFFQAYELAYAPPDSPRWQQESDRRDINTILVPLGRYEGVTFFPNLQGFCASQTWRPVYLDEVSAVFVRRRPETEALINRLEIDCTRIPLVPPANLSATRSSPLVKADQFNFWANAGAVLYSLGRYREALEYLARAEQIFANNSATHYFRALAFRDTGRWQEAESEFRNCIALDPSDEHWFMLGRFYLGVQRYGDAIDAFRQSLRLSSHPYEIWLALGQSYLHLAQPGEALAAFDRAAQLAPFGRESAALTSVFHAQVAAGRAMAWWRLGETQRAIEFQEQSVAFAPQDQNLWLALAKLYASEGRQLEAQKAEARARNFEHP